MLFNKVKGKPNHRLVTNLFGDMNVINKMFGWKDDTDRTRKLAHALSHPIKPQEIDAERGAVPGGGDRRIRRTSTNTWCRSGTRPTSRNSTVGSGIRCVTGEHFDGGSDLGYNRMNFRWGNVGTFQISPGSHMWQVVNKYYKKDEPVPITMCFGVPPACTLLAGAASATPSCRKAATRSASPARCRARRSAWSRRAPSTRWRWPTPRSCWKATSIRTTAASRPRRPRNSGVQGRHHFHPEWAGYMGKAYKAPTFHVTAVTMRKPASKPIVFALGVHMLDDHNIDTTVREATIFELCNRLQPGIIQDVVIPYSMTDWGGCIIQVKKRHQIDEGWQRNFLGAILSCSQGMRLAIAVSEDVDPYSMDDIMWA